MSQARSYDFLGNRHVETGRIPINATSRQDGVYQELKAEMQDWEDRATAVCCGMDAAADAEVTRADLANALYLTSQLSSDVHFPEGWRYDADTGVPVNDRPDVVDTARERVLRSPERERRDAESYGRELRAGELFGPLVRDDRASDPLVDLVGFMTGAVEADEEARGAWNGLVREYMQD